MLEELAVKAIDPSFGSLFLIFDNFKEFFTELQTIGQGSSAMVKKCREKSTGIEYAVKITDFMGEDERLLQVIFLDIFAG